MSGDASLGLVPQSEIYIDRSQGMADEILQLYVSHDFSDVTLVVGTERIPSHKAVLATRSPFFKRMFSEEGQGPEVVLKGTELESFRVVLHYIYGGRFQLGAWSVGGLKKILDLVDWYGMGGLHMDIFKSLGKDLCVANACDIIQVATAYKEDELRDACLCMIDEHGPEAVVTEGFERLPLLMLKDLLERDSLVVPEEITVFRAVAKWAKDRVWEEVETALQCVRMSLIPTELLVGEVQETGLVPQNDILRAITSRVRDEGRPRGVFDVNFVTRQQGAAVIVGKSTANLFDGSLTTFVDCDQLPNTDSPGPLAALGGIVIDLGGMRQVNTIIFCLSMFTQTGYKVAVSSVYPEGSWKCVCNFSEYGCHSKQHIAFAAMSMRYIRVSHAAQAAPRLSSISCMYSRIPQGSSRGILRPRTNFISEATCLNPPSPINFDTPIGHTLGGLKSGICLRLSQPILVGTLRLMVGQTDLETCGFYVKVRGSFSDVLYMISDRSRNNCSGWVKLEFDERVVFELYIVGVKSSAKDGKFYIRNIECPASE